MNDDHLLDDDWVDSQNELMDSEHEEHLRFLGKEEAAHKENAEVAKALLRRWLEYHQKIEYDDLKDALEEVMAEAFVDKVTQLAYWIHDIEETEAEYKRESRA